MTHDQYASREHALSKLMWETGCPIKDARALDLDDLAHDHPSHPRLHFRNRPETGTPLVNGDRDERNVLISDELVNVLIEYIDTQRKEVKDGHGRHPLFTTTDGREQSPKLSDSCHYRAIKKDAPNWV